MSKSYSRMMGGKDAVAFLKSDVRKAVDLEISANHVFRERWGEMVSRMEYEIDKTEPVPVKAIKGRRTDYRCGNCGNVADAVDKYCSNCGFKIDWKNPTVIKLT